MFSTTEMKHALGKWDVLSDHKPVKFVPKYT